MTLTLRKKTLFYVTLTLIALTLILYLVIQYIAGNSFSTLEEDDVSRHVQRVNEAIDNQLGELDSTLRDWALPGQTLTVGEGDLPALDVILDGEESKVSLLHESSLAELIANLKLNLFLFTDASDNIIWGKFYDDENDKVTDVMQSFLLGQLTPNRTLLTHEGQSSVKGVVLLPEDPMLVVSVQFQTQRQSPQGLEPPQIGSMIMGRFLDEAEVKRLAELTRLSLAVRRIDDEAQVAQLSPDFQEARSSLLKDPSRFVRPLSDDDVAGYTLRGDINGAPGLLVRTDVPRDIKKEGNDTVILLLFALIAAGVILVVLIAVLVDQLVLRRLARLNTDVTEIQSTTDLSQRVTELGKDELANLGTAINGMLGGLEVAHEELRLEQEKSERLLLNVLPEPIAERLKEGATTIADSFDEVTVAFSDIVGFTVYSSTVSPEELVHMLNGVFSEFDELTKRHGLEKIKTIGDAYMVAAGLPYPRADHAEAIADMTLEMQEALSKFNAEHDSSLAIRVGVHSGPVVAGVVGNLKFIYDMWGDTVNTAARMESHGVEGRIQVTAETYQRLRETYEFEDRGIIDVKGKGGMNVYLLKGKKAAV